jgi:hypothetical protein
MAAEAATPAEREFSACLRLVGSGRRELTRRSRFDPDERAAGVDFANPSAVDLEKCRDIALAIAAGKHPFHDRGILPAEPDTGTVRLRPTHDAQPLISDPDDEPMAYDLVSA